MDRLGQLRYSLQRSKALAKACKVSCGGSSYLYNYVKAATGSSILRTISNNTSIEPDPPAYLDLLIIRRWQVVASVPVFTYRQLTWRERERELRKEGREVPSRVRLREGPIGVRITLGQPTIG